MINKTNVTKNFKKKINELKKHNKLYFNNDNPVISDKEYDELKKEIIYLQEKHKFLKDLKLIENLVGSPPTNKLLCCCTIISWTPDGLPSHNCLGIIT